MLQLTGGLITIVGVVIMTWGKMRYKKRQEPDPVPASLTLTSIIQPYLISICLGAFCTSSSFLGSSMVRIPAS